MHNNDCLPALPGGNRPGFVLILVIIIFGMIAVYTGVLVMCGLPTDSALALAAGTCGAAVEVSRRAALAWLALQNRSHPLPPAEE